MKKEGKKLLSLQPVPATIVSCRDKDGRNNALVVGFTANVSLDPVMVMGLASCPPDSLITW